MKEWFKARTIWGAAIQTLSDAEAGRLMKALWDFAMTGNQQNLSGAEKGIFALITLQLSQDNIRDCEISEKRALAGAIGGKQRVANASSEKQKQANEAIALIRNKNKEKDIKETLLTECKEKRFVPPTVAEVGAYCRERKNSVNPQTFVDFYTAKGWMIGKNPVRDWKACVRTWENHKDTSTTKTVNAQFYTQREYDSEQDDAMQRMLDEIRG